MFNKENNSHQINHDLLDSGKSQDSNSFPNGLLTKSDTNEYLS